MLGRRSVSGKEDTSPPVGPGSESVRQRSVPERTHLHANVTVIKHVPF